MAEVHVVSTGVSHMCDNSTVSVKSLSGLKLFHFFVMYGRVRAIATYRESTDYMIYKHTEPFLRSRNHMFTVDTTVNLNQQTIQTEA